MYPCTAHRVPCGLAFPTGYFRGLRLVRVCTCTYSTYMHSPACTTWTTTLRVRIRSTSLSHSRYPADVATYLLHPASCILTSTALPRRPFLAPPCQLLDEWAASLSPFLPSSRASLPFSILFASFSLYQALANIDTDSTYRPICNQTPHTHSQIPI